jgi:hypothetical protein
VLSILFSKYQDLLGFPAKIVTALLFMVAPAPLITWLSRMFLNAKEYGLTRIEYEQRWRRARDLCPLGAPAGCIDNVMMGKHVQEDHLQH